MIPIILLTIIFVILSVWIDADHINKYQYIGDHTSRFILRAFVAMLIGSIYGYGMIEVLSGAFLAGAVFYMIFDILLNSQTHQVWNYIGGKSIIDLWFRKYKRLWLPAKVILLILSVTIYSFLNK